MQLSNPYQEIHDDSLKEILQSRVEVYQTGSSGIYKKGVIITILKQLALHNIPVAQSFLTGSAVRKLVRQDQNPVQDHDWKIVFITSKDYQNECYGAVYNYGILTAISEIFQRTGLKIRMQKGELVCFGEQYYASKFVFPSNPHPLELTCQFVDHLRRLSYMPYDLFIPISLYQGTLGSQFHISSHIPMPFGIQDYIQKVKSQIIEYDPPRAETPDPNKWMLLMLYFCEGGYAPVSKIEETWFSEAADTLNPSTFILKLNYILDKKRKSIPDYKFFFLLNACLHVPVDHAVFPAIVDEFIKLSSTMNGSSEKDLFQLISSLFLQEQEKKSFILTYLKILHPLFATRADIKPHRNTLCLRTQVDRIDPEYTFYSYIPIDPNPFIQFYSDSTTHFMPFYRGLIARGESRTCQNDPAAVDAKQLIESGKFFSAMCRLVASELLTEEETIHLFYLLKALPIREESFESYMHVALSNIERWIEDEEVLPLYVKLIHSFREESLIEGCMQKLTTAKTSWNLYPFIYHIPEIAKFIEKNYLQEFKTNSSDDEVYQSALLYRMNEAAHFSRSLQLLSCFLQLSASTEQISQAAALVLNKAKNHEDQVKIFDLLQSCLKHNQMISLGSDHLLEFLKHVVCKEDLLKEESFETILLGFLLQLSSLSEHQINEYAGIWIRDLCIPYKTNLARVPPECWDKIETLIKKSTASSSWKKLWCFLISNLSQPSPCPSLIVTLTQKVEELPVPNLIHQDQKKRLQLYLKAAAHLKNLEPEIAYRYLSKAIDLMYGEQELYGLAHGSFEENFELLGRYKKHSECQMLLSLELKRSPGLRLLPYYERIKNESQQFLDSYLILFNKILKEESLTTIWSLYPNCLPQVAEKIEELDFSDCLMKEECETYVPWIKHRLKSSFYPHRLIGYLMKLDVGQDLCLEYVNKIIQKENSISQSSFDLIWKSNGQVLSKFISDLSPVNLLQLLQMHPNSKEFIDLYWKEVVGHLIHGTTFPEFLLKILTEAQKLELVHAICHKKGVVYQGVQKLIYQISGEGFEIAGTYSWTQEALEIAWKSRPSPVPAALTLFILNSIQSVRESDKFIQQIISYFNEDVKSVFSNKFHNEISENKQTSESRRYYLSFLSQKQNYSFLFENIECYVDFIELCQTAANGISRSHINLLLKFFRADDGMLSPEQVLKRLIIVFFYYRENQIEIDSRWMINEVLWLITQNMYIPAQIYLTWVENRDHLLKSIELCWNECRHHDYVFRVISHIVCSEPESFLNSGYSLFITAEQKNSYIFAKSFNHLFFLLLQNKQTELVIESIKKMSCEISDNIKRYPVNSALFLPYFIQTLTPTDEVASEEMQQKFIDLVYVYLDQDNHYRKEELVAIILDKLLTLPYLKSCMDARVNAIFSCIDAIHSPESYKLNNFIDFCISCQIHIPPDLYLQLCHIDSESAPGLLEMMSDQGSFTKYGVLRISELLLEFATIQTDSSTLSPSDKEKATQLFMSVRNYIQSYDCEICFKILKNLIFISYIKGFDSILKVFYQDLAKMNFPHLVEFLYDSKMQMEMFQDPLFLQNFIEQMQEFLVQNMDDERIKLKCLRMIDGPVLRNISENHLNLFLLALNQSCHFEKKLQYEAMLSNLEEYFHPSKSCYPLTELTSHLNDISCLVRNIPIEYKKRVYGILDVICNYMKITADKVISESFRNSIVIAVEIAETMNDLDVIRSLCKGADSYFLNKRFLKARSGYENDLLLITKYQKTFLDYPRWGYRTCDATKHSFVDVKVWKEFVCMILQENDMQISVLSELIDLANQFIQNKHPRCSRGFLYAIFPHILKIQGNNSFKVSKSTASFLHQLLYTLCRCEADNLDSEQMENILRNVPIQFLTAMMEEIPQMDSSDRHQVAFLSSVFNIVSGGDFGSLSKEKILQYQKNILEELYKCIWSNNYWCEFLIFFERFKKNNPGKPLFEDPQFEMNLAERILDEKSKQYGADIIDIVTHSQLLNFLYKLYAESNQDLCVNYLIEVLEGFIQTDTTWIVEYLFDLGLKYKYHDKHVKLLQAVESKLEEFISSEIQISDVDLSDQFSPYNRARSVLIQIRIQIKAFASSF